MIEQSIVVYRARSDNMTAKPERLFLDRLGIAAKDGGDIPEEHGDPNLSVLAFSHPCARMDR
jgi:hypothetical protein